MSEVENHFTVFVRLPFKRGDFIDPPPVAWSAVKERELWDIISRQSIGNEIDWMQLAEQFQVTQQFLLQQAAWLYERQLSQVRAQMRRMAPRQSATSSPVPGLVAASVMSAQPSKRHVPSTSQGPSRLSTQPPMTSALAAETSIPAITRTSLTMTSAAPVVATSSRIRTQQPSSRQLSRKSSKESEPTSRVQSRRGSLQQQLQLTRSPIESSSSSEDEVSVKPSHRRPNPASTQRRTASMRKSQHSRRSSLGTQQLQEQQEEDEDEDNPAFLPFAHISTKPEQSSSTTTTLTDPSATLRGAVSQATTTTTAPTRPTHQRNHTSERIGSPQASTATTTRPKDRTRDPTPRNLASSTSSLSSSSNPPAQTSPRRTSNQTPHTHRQQQHHQTTLPTPLSPHQQAALATAAGLSPRRRAAAPPNPGQTGSESSASMGSSFSDLDDASVTQSALEEALMSNMNTLGSTTAAGGLGSRVSGISQALRSRYFDARGGRPGDPQR